MPEPPRTFTAYGSAVSSVAECLTVWGDAPVKEIAARYALDSKDALRLSVGAGHLATLLEHERQEDSFQRAEVALAYNVETGTARELPCRDERDYADAREGELWGSLDHVRITHDKRTGEIVLVVRDYKTGRYTMGKSPGRAGQLRAGAVAAAAWLGHTGPVVVELAQVDDKGVWIKFDWLDPFELCVIHGELKALYELITNQVGHDVPKPGAWCRALYCPIRANCPATEAAANAIVKAAEPPFPLTGWISSPEHAAYIRHRLAVLEAVLEERKHAINTFAETTPIPCEDGKVYAQREKQSRTLKIEAPGAVGVLRRHFGDHADDALDMKSSIAAIDRVARKVSPPRKGPALARKVFAELEEIGALYQSTWTKFEEFKPKKEEAAAAE